MTKATKNKVIKSKRTAILLALFFGPFVWLYTYKQSRVKFWISIASSIFTFGLGYFVVWLWALVDTIASEKDYFTKAGPAFTNRQKIFVVSCLIALGLVLVGLIANSVYQSDKAAKKAQERKEELSSDPITSQAIFTAINKSRSSSGVSALGTLNELTKAAQQKCSDMSKAKYFEYKNPKTGKDANSYITDNQGELYFKYYVSSIFKATTSETATEAVEKAMADQAQNLGDPKYNSVGWAVCSTEEDNVRYIVGMLAEDAEKPAAPVNNYYQTPSYTPPVTCYSTSYSFSNTTTTTCY